MRESPPARVVWIEISIFYTVSQQRKRRHPRGWCGLKSYVVAFALAGKVSPPARVVWIEIKRERRIALIRFGRHPRGWCGLKSYEAKTKNGFTRRHPRGWCGLKSLYLRHRTVVGIVATREGGVD